MATTLKLSEPYVARAVRCLEIWPAGEWRMKVYGIAHRGDQPSQGLIAAGKKVAQRLLRDMAARHEHYGVGILGVHQGRGEDVVFVDWWADENELHHHVFTAPSMQPDRLQYALPDRPIICVWDLAVLAFERQAWLDTVLANPSGPDFEAYLATKLEGRL